MIFRLRARSHVYHIDFFTIPYIRAHIFGVGSANTRKHYRPTPERISSCTRSLRTWWALDGKYLYFLSIWFNIVALIHIRQYLFWFDFFQLDEMMNLWICRRDGESVNRHHGVNIVWMSTSHVSIWPWSGAPKVHLYDTLLGSLRHLPPRMKNQHELNEGKNHIGKKISLIYECLWCDTCG